MGNKNIHSVTGILELVLLLLVISFIPFHIVALSRETIQILDNSKYRKYKRVVGKIKKATFFYSILGFMYILAIILSGAGITVRVNPKFIHTFVALFSPIAIIYIFSKQYYFGLMLYKIEERVTSQQKS
ncbi:MAG: hypothetical protein ACK4NF_02560 [Planctomycetota bacterium]